MSITENFLVNTKNFEAIIEKLRTTSKLPNRITNKFLEQLGYSNPSDLLVLHLFKDLDMLTEEGEPTPLFNKFRNKGEDKQAMAEGIVQAYTGLFQNNSDAHKLPAEKLKEEFKEFFGSSKSDLILKYMASTFTTLVNYAGSEKVERASQKVIQKETAVENPIEQVSKKQQNGHAKADTAPERTEEEVTVADKHDSDDENIRKEEKGEKAIEDFISKSASESTDSSADDSIPDPEILDQMMKDSSTSSEKGEDDINISGDDDDVLEYTDAGDITPFSPDAAEDTEADSDFEFSGPLPNQKDENDDFSVSGSDPDDDPFGLQEDIVASESDADSDDETIETPDLDVNLDIDAEPEKSTNAKNKEFVDKAVLKKAELLFKLKKYEEALPAFKKVIDRYGDSNEPHIKDQVAKAVLRRASILNKTDRYDEALPAFDEVFTRFENSDNPEYYKHASIALIKQVQILEMLGLEEQLVPLYAKVIERFSDSGDPKYAKYVDKATIKQAEIILESGEPKKALEVANNVIKRFKDSGAENELLEKAMFMKAELLEQLGRDAEALKAYEIYLNTYGDGS